MSIISVYETDNSDFMYKKFASLASSYLDEPETKRSDSANVPLENLFQLLEMYRYDAFSDESRSGVLALDDVNTRPSDDEWYTKIKTALEQAVVIAYGNVSKEKAVDELEETLRLIARNTNIQSAMQKKAKKFFEKFLEELS